MESQKSHWTQTSNQLFSRTLILMGLVFFNCFATSAQGQILGWPPGKSDDSIKNCAPQGCLAWVSIASTGQYDINANPTEAWIAQPEIQKSLNKLIAAIEKFARQNASRSEAGDLLFSGKPSDFLKRPMALFWSSFDPNDIPNGSGGAFVMNLGPLEERAAALLKAIAAEGHRKFEIRNVKGSDVYYFLPPKGQPEISVAINENNLIMVWGKETIENVLANMKTPPAAWMTELENRTAVERPVVTAYADIQSWVGMVNNLKGDDLKQWQALDAVFQFSKFKTFQFQSGMNEDGFNETAYLNHQQPLQGIMAALSADAFTDDALSEIPADVGVCNAIKLSPEKILELVHQTISLEMDDSQNTYENFKKDFRERAGADLENDLIASIDGSFWFYGEKSLTSPKIVGAIGLKDEQKFETVLKGFVQWIDDLPNSSVTREEKKGITYYTLANRSGFDNCFAIADNTFYICNSARGITSHLRKKKRTSGKLIRTPAMKKILAKARASGEEAVIGLSLFDLAAVFEIGFPIARVTLSNYMDREKFDFTMDDIPEVGVLIDGLRPNQTVIFRTKTGLAFHSTHDFPVGLEATSGITIGMLLPAVQQVRAAARKTIVQNNLRRLSLAILNHESKNGHLPPAYSVDENGNRLLSWRVHLLPLLGQQKLYDQFKLDQPWDSPHNLPLADAMPELFKHPGLSLPKGHTIFLAPVNQNSALSDGPVDQQGNGIKFNQITDSKSNTWLVIEANQKHSVVWTSPEDLRVDEFEDDQLADAITGYLKNTNIVMCDGATYTLRPEGVTTAESVNLRGSMKVSDGNEIQLSP